MVVRIHNPTKWARLEQGQMLALPGAGSRKVRLELNCSAPTHVMLQEGEGGQTFFLAVVDGMEVIEFAAGPDAFVICTTDGEVWYFTNDGDAGSYEVPNAVSFAKIANRRSRNPQLEMMMWKMEQRMNARLAQQAEELAAWQAAHGADAETGEVDDDLEQRAAPETPDGPATPEPPAEYGRCRARDC